MIRPKRSLHLLLVFVLAGGLSSCLFDRPIQPPRGKNAGQLYKEGVSALNAKNYRQAIETFYKLKYDFPDEAAAMLADLKIADAYYADEDYSEAIEAYEEFRKMHPASPYIPYVVYMLGLCHFQMIHSVDRDQTNTERALSEFKYLLTHFPNTPYVYDASEKAQECMRRLSQHEVYVGNFYFRMKKYKAAILRYESALKRFPSIPLEPETLYRLGEAYRRTDQPQKAKEVWETLLKQYPKDKYSRKAADRLRDLSGQAKLTAGLTTKTSPKPSHEAEVRDKGLHQESLSRKHSTEKEESSPPRPQEDSGREAPSPQAPSPDTLAQSSDQRAFPASEKKGSETSDQTGAIPPADESEAPRTENEKSTPEDLVSLFGKVQSPPDLQGQGPEETSQEEDEPHGLHASREATERPSPAEEGLETDNATAVQTADIEEAREQAPVHTRGEGISRGEPLAQESPSSEEKARPAHAMASRERSSEGGLTSAEAPSPRESQTSEPSKIATPAPQPAQGSAPPDDTPDEGASEKSMGFVELRGDLPINITADRMDAFQKENRVVFEGNVVVNQKDTYIYAQRISAELAPQERGGGIRKVVASKDVRITQGDRVATCDRAKFDNISRIIELSGNPKIWSGKDRIDGERVVIQLDQEKMTVVGSEDRRVSAVLYPKSQKVRQKPKEGSKGGVRPTFVAPFAPPAEAAEPPPAPKTPAGEEAPPMEQVQTAQRDEAPTPQAASLPSDSPPSATLSEPQTAPIPSALYAEEQYAKIPSRLTGVEEEKAEETSLSKAQEIEEEGETGRAAPSVPSTSQAQAVDESEVLAFLERWRSAWENKKLDAYMECYSRRFRSGGKDWNGWKAYKARLNRRYHYIRVEMEDVRVTTNHQGVHVSFIQDYQSDRYKDRGLKTLHLVREDGQWKILREEWKAL